MVPLDNHGNETSQKERIANLKFGVQSVRGLDSR